MGAFQWTPDVLPGVMKNRHLSSELRHASVAKTVALPFFRAEPGFGRKMGDTITIPRVGNLAVPTSSVIGQSNKLAIDKVTLNQTTIMVQKMGRGVEFSEDSQLLSKFDPQDFLQIALQKQLRAVMDAACGVAMKTALTTYTPTGAATSATTTDGGATAPVASSNMNVFHVRAIKDILEDTLLADPYEDEHYICLSSTKGVRGIMNDAEFKDWRVRLDPEQPFYRGLVGEIEDIRFVKTNNKSLLKNVGAGSVLGEQIYFGADAFAMAEVMTPELRMSAGPLGLQVVIAWVGMLGFGCVWDSSSAQPGEARVVRVMSQ